MQRLRELSDTESVSLSDKERSELEILAKKFISPLEDIKPEHWHLVIIEKENAVYGTEGVIFEFFEYDEICRRNLQDRIHYLGTIPELLRYDLLLKKAETDKESRKKSEVLGNKKSFTSPAFSLDYIQNHITTH